MSNRKYVITATLLAALSAAALSGCTAPPVNDPGASATSTSERASSESSAPTDGPELPAGCAALAKITDSRDPRGDSDGVDGELVDQGASDVASGEVGLDADGEIATYTVNPGDTLIGIGERFCADHVSVGLYNDRFGSTAIQPGDVLVLRPGAVG